MFIYQPYEDSDERVVWYGGESTQLHYEIESVDDYGNLQWIECKVCDLCMSMPTGISELHAKLVEYYNECQIPEST